MSWATEPTYGRADRPSSATGVPRRVIIRIGSPKKRPADGYYECLTEIDEGEYVSVKPVV